MDIEARVERIERQTERDLGSEGNPGALWLSVRTLNTKMRRIYAALWYGDDSGKPSIMEEIASLRTEQRVCWILLLAILTAIGGRIFGWF